MNKTIEEMTELIRNTWLPIMQGDVTVGETHISDYNAIRIAETLYKAGYKKPIEGVWTLNKDGSGTCRLCGFTQRAVWDYDNYQRYCSVCGALMKLEG
jgi:hypothetical protein